MRSAAVVDSGGKMAALGDASGPALNGLIQQFTAITGKYVDYSWIVGVCGFINFPSAKKNNCFWWEKQSTEFELKLEVHQCLSCSQCVCSTTGEKKELCAEKELE